MKNMLNKLKKVIVVGVVTCMCAGCMTVFGSSVIRQGNNFTLKYTGTSDQLVIYMSDIQYVEQAGANYVFSSISNNTSGKYNYVKTKVTSKSFWGKWSTLGTVTKTHSFTGSVYCPRITPGLTRVYGIKVYASNNFSSGETGYGQTATCTTKSTYGYVAAD